MRILILSAFLLVPAFSQQPNTVSATVSTNQTVAAASATFRVQFVDASLNSSLDTALGVVGGAGASTANLAGISVSLSQQGFVLTQYDFLITVTAGDLPATRDKLLAAQRAIANVNSQAIGWSTAYGVTDDDIAKALEQAMPNLLNQGKQQAGVLATAMGAKLGKISSISTPGISRSGVSLAVTATVTYLLE